MNRENKTSTSEERGARRARTVGLVYINDPENGIIRRRCGRGFTYLSSRGKRITAKTTRKRIEELVIPPAWEEVHICSKSNGHIQAVGRDEGGRKQYLYHERWKAASTATKFDRMHLMGQILPRVRRRVRKDLNRKKLDKPRVYAAIVRLLDKAHLRVGNAEYTEAHGTYGATTLKEKHVSLDGIKISLDFPGKSHQRREIKFSDKKIARVVNECEDIDGQFLFSYTSDNGGSHAVDSNTINDYLQDITQESITAKDFRTWSGSVIALSELIRNTASDLSKHEKKRAANAAVDKAARELGNTKAVCRSSYIHPALLAAFDTGELDALVRSAKSNARRRDIAELSKDEQLFAALLPKLSS